jgi:cytochrome c oxidase subunit 4
MTETRSAFLVWLGLLVLLAISAGTSRLDLGWANPAINLAVAGAKSLLILIVFMHLRRKSTLAGLVASAIVLWLAIMYTLVGADYLTR